MHFYRWLVLIFPLLTFSTANAHNIWIEKILSDTSTYVVKFGHDKTEPYPEHKLKAVKLLDESGRFSSANYRFINGEAYFETSNASIVFLKFDNGVWSKLPNGKYVERNKKDMPDAVASVGIVKFGKAILTWDEQSLKPHQMEYELILQAKPVAGKPLDILVLHLGRPVKGAKVGIGEDKPFLLTDENGIAQYTPTKGRNHVWADFAEKDLDHPDYSERSIEYMLTFDTQEDK